MSVNVTERLKIAEIETLDEGGSNAGNQSDVTLQSSPLPNSCCDGDKEVHSLLSDHSAVALETVAGSPEPALY